MTPDRQRQQDTRPGRKPTTPRPPATGRQPARPQPTARDTTPKPAGSGRPPQYVIVLWQAPELRQRNPNLPLSLHEALQVGKLHDPRYPIPRLAPPWPDPEPEPQGDHQAEP